MRPKILTVDDSKTIRVIVAKSFSAYDCEVLEASNGVEGLSVASKEKPNVIILDLTMPVMDGVEMLTKLKATPELKSIPVIMLTAEAGKENVLKIARLGVRDYLIKPFKEETLIERVGRVVELSLREEEARVRRFDDALNILVVDDKPAIAEQIRHGLAATPWVITSKANATQALEACAATIPDAVLVSLSLPDGGAFSLFQKLRATARLRSVPVFALSVKASVDEQIRAQQCGFTGVITKPIDVQDVRAKVTQALNLDTSYQFFEMRDGAAVLRIPSDCGAQQANEITASLRTKLAEAVDAGVDKLVIDMSQVASAEVEVIKLGLAVSRMCEEFSLKHRMIGSDAVSHGCRNYQETKDWQFENTFEEALAALNGGALASAAV